MKFINQNQGGRVYLVDHSGKSYGYYRQYLFGGFVAVLTYPVDKETKQPTIELAEQWLMDEVKICQ